MVGEDDIAARNADRIEQGAVGGRADHRQAQRKRQRVGVVPGDVDDRGAGERIGAALHIGEPDGVPVSGVGVTLDTGARPQDLLEDQHVGGGQCQGTIPAFGELVGQRRAGRAGGQAALTARMDLVETGQIVQADSMSGDALDMRELSQQLAAKFLRPLDQIVAEQEAHVPVGTAEPPPDAVSYFNKGVSYEGSGDYNRAIDMFTRALTIYPHYADARSELEKASESAARQQ